MLLLPRADSRPVLRRQRLPPTLRLPLPPKLRAPPPPRGNPGERKKAALGGFFVLDAAGAR
jgi:hypothetical protein